MATRLTERAIKALESPAARPVIHWDSELGGFGVRVTTKGVRAFVLDYRAGGRQRRRLAAADRSAARAYPAGHHGPIRAPA